MEFQPMSPEEMQRTTQFLLAHQTQFAADFERLSIKVDGLADKGTVERLGGTVERLRDSERRVDARLIELAEQGKATDAKLAALIDLFERHLREDHPPRPS